MLAREKGLPLGAIFSRAIREGRKTQLRSPIDPPPVWFAGPPEQCKEPGYEHMWQDSKPWLENETPIECPFGAPGQRFWIKESVSLCNPGADGEPLVNPPVFYHADKGHCDRTKYPHKRRCEHMPKWCARTFIEVRRVWTHNLLDITEQDARAEGVEPLFTPEDAAARPEFRLDPMPYTNYLWNGFIGKRCTEQFSSKPTARESFLSLWDRKCRESETAAANPLVWACEFVVVENNQERPSHATA